MMSLTLYKNALSIFTIYYKLQHYYRIYITFMKLVLKVNFQYNDACCEKHLFDLFALLV